MFNITSTLLTLAMWVDTFTAHTHELLLTSEPVLEFLWGRGVSNDQIESFNLGYFDGELPPAQYSSEFLDWAKGGLKLRQTLVFPLTNVLGSVRGVQVRALDRSKYSDFFLTSSEPVLFGLGQAMPHIWKDESTIVVEGVFDLFPVQRVNPTVVSTLTAKVSESFARTLKRVAHTIYPFYDSDAKGRHGVEAIRTKYGRDLTVRPIEYPLGLKLIDGTPIKDPGNLWEALGDERFAQFLTQQLE